MTNQPGEAHICILRTCSPGMYGKLNGAGYGCVVKPPRCAVGKRFERMQGHRLSIQTRGSAAMRISKSNSMIAWTADRLPWRARAVLPIGRVSGSRWRTRCVEAHGAQRSPTDVDLPQCRRRTVTREATTRHVVGGLIAVVLLSTVIQISPLLVTEKSPPPVGQSVVSSARTRPALSFSLSR